MDNTTLTILREIYEKHPTPFKAVSHGDVYPKVKIGSAYVQTSFERRDSGGASYAALMPPMGRSAERLQEGMLRDLLEKTWRRIRG